MVIIVNNTTTDEKKNVLAKVKEIANLYYPGHTSVSYRRSGSTSEYPSTGSDSGRSTPSRLCRHCRKKEYIYNNKIIKNKNTL
jgi:hypothetical protein